MTRAKSAMVLPTSILASIVLFSLPNFTSAETDNGDECSCFRTNGSSQGYFLNHQFHDYRNVAGASSPPALIPNSTDATNAFATSSFFREQSWTGEWATQNWNNSDNLASSGASVLMVNTPNNVYLGTLLHSTSLFSVIPTATQSRATIVLQTTPPTSPSAPRGTPTSNQSPR